jgi:hypothetical protein
VARTRFNAGFLLAPSAQYECIYFADDTICAQFETRAQLGEFMPGMHLPNPHTPIAALNVRVNLHKIMDVSEVAAQSHIGTTVQELTGDWQGYQVRSPGTNVKAPTGPSPTQDLGWALFRTGVEGFRATSARMPWHKTLIVFPANMRVGSWITYTDPSGVVHRIDGTVP